MMHVIKGDITTDIVTLDEKTLDHKYSLQFANHSPTGFSWGYGGSGPAQLSLAILLALIPADQALVLYHDFKWEFVARIPRDSIFCLEVDIEEWVKDKLQDPATKEQVREKREYLEAFNPRLLMITNEPHPKLCGCEDCGGAG